MKGMLQLVELYELCVRHHHQFLPPAPPLIYLGCSYTTSAPTVLPFPRDFLFRQRLPFSYLYALSLKYVEEVKEEKKLKLIKTLFSIHMQE
jgi:hypothetical protein